MDINTEKAAAEKTATRRAAMREIAKESAAAFERGDMATVYRLSDEVDTFMNDPAKTARDKSLSTP